MLKAFKTVKGKNSKTSIKTDSDEPTEGFKKLDVDWNKIRVAALKKAATAKDPVALVESLVKNADAFTPAQYLRKRLIETLTKAQEVVDKLEAFDENVDGLDLGDILDNARTA